MKRPVSETFSEQAPVLEVGTVLAGMPGSRLGYFLVVR
ncbi:hypothetical protein BVI1335_1940012 [Burkholderia vietnamiensis]|nr:hypothetical protein BVI1335_1940012 [Burkholderia vietnamiensis]